MWKSNRFETARVTGWSISIKKELPLNIKEALLEEHSKAQTLKIKRYIGPSHEKFKELMDLLLEDEYRIVQRASWVVKHTCDSNPLLIYPYLGDLIPRLRTPLHDAYKRNILHILSMLEVPEEHLGELTDICFESLENRKEAVAIRVHAMQNLHNICFKEPELANELKLFIEEFMPHESAGFKSRGKKIINSLRKNKLIE